MKKLLAFTCAMVMAACAFAAGNLKADDCELGEAKDGAVIKGDFKYSVSKGIVVSDKSAEPIKNGSVSYKKRIDTKGISDGIVFSAKKGEVVTIIGTSGSKKEARSFTVRPFDKQSKKIGSVQGPEWNIKDPKFSAGTITIPADGEYIVRGSSGGGMYIFEIDIK